MRGKAVTVGFTKNLGNYQSLRVEVTLEIEETDAVDYGIETAAALAREACDEQLSVREEQILADYRHGERNRLQALVIRK